MRRRSPASLAIIALLGAGLLGGCGDTRKALGFDKSAPDEFRIVNRAPLSLPPDYALRPPQPGASRPQEQASTQRALAAVTGNSGLRQTPAATAGSVGESALLARAGVDRVNPGIREIVERESSVLAAADQTFLDRVMFWRKPDDRSPVVDANREAQRLRENAALGRAINEGDTPTVRRRKRAPLEGLFDWN
jgi:hypothetical protein